MPSVGKFKVNNIWILNFYSKRTKACVFKDSVTTLGVPYAFWQCRGIFVSSYVQVILPAKWQPFDTNKTSNNYTSFSSTVFFSDKINLEILPRKARICCFTSLVVVSALLSWSEKETYMVFNKRTANIVLHCYMYKSNSLYSSFTKNVPVSRFMGNVMVEY